MSLHWIEVCMFHLGHGVSKQTVQQLVRVLPLHDELSKRRQVDHSHLLHHQLAFSANWSEPVGAPETGPEHSKKKKKIHGHFISGSVVLMNTNYFYWLHYIMQN